MESTLLFPIECHCVEICALHACEQNCTGFSVVCKPLMCDMFDEHLYGMLEWRCANEDCMLSSDKDPNLVALSAVFTAAPIQPHQGFRLNYSARAPLTQYSTGAPPNQSQPNCQITTRNLPKHNLRLGKRSSPKTNMSLAHTTLFLDIMGCSKWCCSKLVMDLHVFFSVFWGEGKILYTRFRMLFIAMFNYTSEHRPPQEISSSNH